MPVVCVGTRVASQVEPQGYACVAEPPDWAMYCHCSNMYVGWEQLCQTSYLCRISFQATNTHLPIIRKAF